MSHRESLHSNSPSRGLRRRRFGQQMQVLVLGLGALAGLLLWARLKIVTDSPRTAFAVPAEVESADVSSQEEIGEPEPSEKTRTP